MLAIEEKHKQLWAQGSTFLAALAAEAGTPVTPTPAGLKRQAVKADAESLCCVCSSRIRVGEPALYDDDARMASGRRATHLRCWGEAPGGEHGELWPVTAHDPRHEDFGPVPHAIAV